MHLFLDQAANAVLGEIHLAGAYAQRFSNFPGRPFFHHVQVEHLELFLFDLALHAVNGGIKQVLFPFLVPVLFQRWPIGASKLLQRVRLRSQPLNEPSARSRLNFWMSLATQITVSCTTSCASASLSP